MFLLKIMFRGSQEARFSLLIVSTVITQDLSYQHKSTGSPAISVVQGVRGKSSSAWWALSVLSAYNRRAKSSSLWFVSIINPPLWNQVPYFLGLVMLPQLGGRKFWCFIRSTEANYKSIPIHSSKRAQLDARSFCQTLWNSFAFSLMFSNNGFPGRAVVKNPPANTGNARDVDLIPGSGRSPEVGNGNPLQYSCLENSTDRGAWRDTLVQGVSKSQTWLSTVMASYVYLLDILAPQVCPDFYTCTFFFFYNKHQGQSSTANTPKSGKFATHRIHILHFYHFFKHPCFAFSSPHWKSIISLAYFHKKAPSPLIILAVLPWILCCWGSIFIKCGE